MTARDWFGVAARVLGIWLLIQAVSGLVTAFAMQRGWMGYEPDSGVAKYRLAHSATELIIGIVLLARTQFFIDLAYPEKDEFQTDRDDELTDNSESSDAL